MKGWQKAQKVKPHRPSQLDFCITGNKGLFSSFTPFKFNFEKSIERCHSAMKFGVVNKSTILNRFVLHTLQRNITHLAVITRKTNIRLGILKGGGEELEKSRTKMIAVGRGKSRKRT